MPTSPTSQSASPTNQPNSAPVQPQLKPVQPTSPIPQPATTPSSSASVPPLASQTVYSKPSNQVSSMPQPTLPPKTGQVLPGSAPSASKVSTQLPPPSLKPNPIITNQPAGSPGQTPTSPAPAGAKSAMPLANQPASASPIAPKPLVPLGGAAQPAKFGTATTPGATPVPNKGVGTTVAKAEIKKPPFWLFAIVGVLLLGLIGYIAFSALSGKSSKPTSQNNTVTTDTNTTPSGGVAGKPKTPVKQTSLIYWGLWEPNEVMTSVITDFETANPQYKIDYRKQSHKDYRERLQTAIASGNGPDFFRMHASWVPMLIDDLAALPTSVMNATDFNKTFYPIAVEQLTLDNKIMGMPLMYDGLGLYYNKEMLKTANVEPPQTWADLKTLADSLTVPSDKAERGRGTLQRAGLAIGNATNVEHFSDIFGLLVKQNGGDLSSPNSTEVRDALLFYTNFVKEDKVWSDAMPSSTVAFARGDVAMMFAPSWRALEVKAMNPNLDFGVAPVPKLGDQRMGWASYWAEGVNSKSKNQEGAWVFIKFLAEKTNQEKFFTAASQVRPFGEPYARQDMALTLAADPVLGSILADGPSATGWYLSSFTHDNGLNDQMIKYYGDAINATLDGKSVEEVLTTLDTGVTKVLRQYSAK